MTMSKEVSLVNGVLIFVAQGSGKFVSLVDRDESAANGEVGLAGSFEDLDFSFQGIGLQPCQ